MAENYFGITDKGRVRDNNEDNFIAEPVMKGSMIAACVIDGVGGYEGGEVAAAIARESILKNLNAGVSDIFQSLRNALVNANNNIYREKTETSANQEMACVVTLALVDIPKNRFYYVHVGDTRLYLFRDSSLVKITRDQSFVGFLEDSGRLTEEEAMNHPKRNEINKALGFDNQVEVQKDYMDSGESPFLPGDLLLLCSDGLTDMIGSREMVSILSSNGTVKEKAEALVQAANQAGGKDNITVVLVKNEKKPVRQKATKPVLIKKQQPEEQVKAVEKTEPVVSASTRKRKNGISGWIIPLIIIILLSIATSVYLFREHFVKDEKTDEPLPVQKNQAESRLQNLISQSQNDTINLAAFGSPLTLTDSLYINRERLVLKGPATFNRDSNFRRGGPAIVIGPACRQVVMDSITFNGFDLAIVSHDPSILEMKDLQYINTRLSIAYVVKQQEPIPASDSVSRPVDSLINRKN